LTPSAVDRLPSTAEPWTAAARRDRPRGPRSRSSAGGRRPAVDGPRSRLTWPVVGRLRLTAGQRAGGGSSVGGRGRVQGLGLRESGRRRAATMAGRGGRLEDRPTLSSARDGEGTSPRWVGAWGACIERRELAPSGGSLLAVLEHFSPCRSASRRAGRRLAEQ